MYREFLSGYLNEGGLMEEAPLPAHTPPDMSQGQQYVSNQAGNQSQNQSRSEGQTQIRLQPQPQQNAVANANGPVPRRGLCFDCLNDLDFNTEMDD